NSKPFKSVYDLVAASRAGDPPARCGGRDHFGREPARAAKIRPCGFGPKRGPTELYFNRAGGTFNRPHTTCRPRRARCPPDVRSLGVSEDGGPARRPSRGPDTRQEALHLAPQRLGLIGQLAGAVPHHLGRLAGLAGRVGEARHLLTHEPGALGHLMDVLRHLARGGALLLDRRSHGGGDLVDACDGGTDVLDSLDRLLGGALDRADLSR